MSVLVVIGWLAIGADEKKQSNQDEETHQYFIIENPRWEYQLYGCHGILTIRKQHKSLHKNRSIQIKPIVSLSFKEQVHPNLSAHIDFRKSKLNKYMSHTQYMISSILFGIHQLFNTFQLQHIQTPNCSIPNMIKYKVPDCVHHHSPYQYFCESCNEPICKKCTISGPHNNELHLINHINESYKQKVAEISESISRALPDKRRLILAQIYRLEYRLEQVKTYTAAIHQNNLQFSLDTTNQLSKSLQAKTLLLKKTILDFTNQLHSINDTGHQLQSILQLPQPHIQLLASYRKLDEALHQSVAKVLDWNINIHPEDLPKRLSELRYEVRKIRTYDELIVIKLGVMSRVLEKRREEMEGYAVESGRELQVQRGKIQREIEEELKEMEENLLVCNFCGRIMDQEVINTECKQNIVTGSILLPNFRGFCKNPPQHELMGTGRHYFGEIADIAVRKQSQNILSTYLNALYFKLKTRVLHNDKLNLPTILQTHDKSKHGKIRKLDMMYILVELYQTTQLQASTIIRDLPSDHNLVAYQPLLDKLQ